MTLRKTETGLIKPIELFYDQPARPPAQLPARTPHAPIKSKEPLMKKFPARMARQKCYRTALLWLASSITLTHQLYGATLLRALHGRGNL
jgi:hypothetical protein